MKNSGQGLIQALIAVGLLTGIALFFASSSVYQDQAKTAATGSGTWESLTETMEAILSYRDTCSQNFTNPDNGIGSAYNPTIEYDWQALGYTSSSADAFLRVGSIYGGIRIDSIRLLSSMSVSPPPTATVDFDPSVPATPGPEDYTISYGFVEMNGTHVVGPLSGKTRTFKSFISKYKMNMAGLPPKVYCFSKNDNLSPAGDHGGYLFTEQQACEMLGGIYASPAEEASWYLNPMLPESSTYSHKKMPRCRLTQLVVSTDPGLATSAPPNGALISGSLFLEYHRQMEASGTTFQHGRGAMSIANDILVRNPASGLLQKPCRKDGANCPAIAASNKSPNLRNAPTIVTINNSVSPPTFAPAGTNTVTCPSAKGYLADSGFQLVQGTWYTGEQVGLTFYKYAYTGLGTDTPIGNITTLQNNAFFPQGAGYNVMDVPSQIQATCVKPLHP